MMFKFNKRATTRDFSAKMMHMIIIININNLSIIGHRSSEIIKIISHSIAIQTLLINIKRKKILFHNAINIIRRLNPPYFRTQREVPPNNQSLAIGHKF
jgi:hypothetical protein